MERGSLFGRGQAGGGAACPLFFALFCRNQQQHGAFCLAAGLPAVGLRPWASCRCAPPTVAGESGNGSARCGGDRHILAGVRLPLSSVGPRTATHGVEAANNLPSSGVTACRRAPPTVAGESGNGSAWCGDGRQGPTTFGVRAWMTAGACLYYCGRVWERLCAGWRQPASAPPSSVQAWTNLLVCLPPFLVGQQELWQSVLGESLAHIRLGQ